MRKVIPTVFARNKKEFDERFNKLVKISKELQIDFMDGKFVRAKGISLEYVPNLKKFKGKKFEAHLMVNNPETWISKLKEKGFKKVMFHIESVKNTMKILKIIDLIKKEKMEAWVALNPKTPVKKIFNIVSEFDGVLFMGVYPGKEGQKFKINVLDKIRELKNKDSKSMVQVDGGVNLKIIRKLKKFGVNYVNSGSFVADAENTKEALNELRRAFQ